MIGEGQGQFMASRFAVDGNLNPDFKSRSCAMTGTTMAEPLWWSVDLLVSYTVTLVRIVNRGDANGNSNSIFIHSIIRAIWNV